MAAKTWLDITTEDAQGYQATLTFRIKPAAFGATTLPTEAKIEAVIDALYGDDKLSDQQIVKYAVRVEEDVVGGLGGGGAVGTSQALRIRSGDSDSADALWRIPGFLKDSLVKSPDNPNSYSTADALVDALRTALVDAAIAVAPPADPYTAYTSDQIAKSANTFDGRRAPLRPK